LRDPPLRAHRAAHARCRSFANAPQNLALHGPHEPGGSAGRHAAGYFRRGRSTLRRAWTGCALARAGRAIRLANLRDKSYLMRALRVKTKGATELLRRPGNFEDEIAN